MESTGLFRIITSGVLAMTILSTGCGQTVYPTSFQLYELHTVSTVPAVRGAGGEYHPVCSGEQSPDGLLMYLTLLGTEQSTSKEGEFDKDRSIRPGDEVRLASDPNFPSDGVRLAMVAEGETIGSDHFVQNIACMEPYSENNSPTPDICDGMAPSTSTNPSWLKYISDFPANGDGYYPRTFREKDQIGVAILVDQSGSMKGLVDKHTFKEIDYKEGQILWNQPTWEPDGSDSKGQHISAVERFLHELNPNERAIVFQYGGETGKRPEPVCWNPDGLEGTDLYQRCYSTDRGLVLDSHPEYNHSTAELSKLVNGGQGRTPLWEAVDEVYDFMTWTPDTESRHIVVIGDGPDTCHIDSPEFLPVVRKDLPNDQFEYVGQPQCSSTSYEDVKNRILADLANPMVPGVHVHFVQFQAPGYRERDPRQQELACLTGGHYIFVNSESIPKEDKDAPPRRGQSHHRQVPVSRPGKRDDADPVCHGGKLGHGHRPARSISTARGFPDRD